MQKLASNKGPLVKIALAVIAVIIVVGALVGLFGNFGLYGSNLAQTANFGLAPRSYFGGLSGSSNSGGSGPSFNGDQNIPISSQTVVGTTLTGTSSQTNPQGSPSSNAKPQNNSGSIEFFSNITLSVSSPSDALVKAGAVAYSYGGYLAFSSYNNQSALAVLRIPAPNYQNALGQVESIGKVTALQSTSNDVTLQVVDLNATLQSLFTEEASLLKLENQSTSLNSTLAIESQIQGINAQINQIESELLQTRLLVDYSTITATFYQESVAQVLSLKLTATPQSGTLPVGVTLTALVSGGSPPYIIYYDFGDGNSYEGSSVIHTFYSAGTFNVTATVTDSAGNAREVWTLISVNNPSSTTSPYLSFLYYVGGLFISVVEGIVEVAVVVLPVGLVIGVVILPIRNRLKTSSTKREEEPKGSS